MKKRKQKKHNMPSVGLVALADSNSRVTEQFRTLRTNIQFAVVDQKMKSLVVTSAAPDSGKTTIASNLAASFAMQGSQVLLCECDLRRPSIHKVFQLPNALGLTNLLTDPSLNIENVFVKTQVEGLTLLTAGPIPPNPAELLASKRMGQLENDLDKRFDLIIYDTPPLLGFSDGQIMAGKADGTIFVVQHGVAKKEDILKSREILEMAHAHVLGVVYNQVPEGNQDGSYYYYYTDEK